MKASQFLHQVSWPILIKNKPNYENFDFLDVNNQTKTIVFKKGKFENLFFKTPLDLKASSTKMPVTLD